MSYITNDVQLIAHVGCKNDFQKLQINNECNIKEINTFVFFPGKIFQGKANYFGLAKYIGYYASKEYELIKFPVKNLQKLNLKISNKLEVLGYAYALIFINFIGNLTPIQPASSVNPDLEHFTRYFRGFVEINDETT